MMFYACAARTLSQLSLDTIKSVLIPVLKFFFFFVDHFIRRAAYNNASYVFLFSKWERS